MKSWRAWGLALPSCPVAVWAEDFSRVILKADRTRMRHPRITARTARPCILH